MKTKLTALEQHKATVEAMGYAIGRAAPLLAQFPPTDFKTAGFTMLKLSHLYDELFATPAPGADHISQAAIINGIVIGLGKWAEAQPVAGETH